MFVVNAFSGDLHGGNPAGVLCVEQYPLDGELRKMVTKAQLPEVSFIRQRRQLGHFDIRWLTSELELDMCGHGTVAAAHIVFNALAPNLDKVHFYSQSGKTITVERCGTQLRLTLDKLKVTPCDEHELLASAVGCDIHSLYKGRSYLAWVEDEGVLKALKPDEQQLMALSLPGVIVAAPGKHHDYVCRYFAPQKGIYEDAVTGTAHITIASLLHQQSGQTVFEAAQLSSRGGQMTLKVEDDGVVITTSACTVSG